MTTNLTSTLSGPCSSESSTNVKYYSLPHLHSLQMDGVSGDEADTPGLL
jgi:hypothetical protein